MELVVLSLSITFARFFFISDDELLSILGSSDPSCVQEHMIKMYDNIASLRFQEGVNNETVATAMISAEGEVSSEPFVISKFNHTN